MASLLSYLRSCTVCPNACQVDRTAGRTGRCRVDDSIVVSSADLHFGEESCLVGSGGSGTIFLAACSLGCVYCQNYEISQLDRGVRISPAQFQGLLMELQDRGAENINLVTPTHQAPQLFDAIARARQGSLRLPVVYNCGGYENPAFLSAIDGLVDIYMPDFKYGGDEEARRYSGIREYVRWCTASLLEMQRQVGSLRLDDRGIARRGLLIRHLVLPGDLARSASVIDWIAGHLPADTVLHVMDQYRPCYRAAEEPLLRRRVLERDVERVIEHAQRRGLTRVLR